MTETQDEATDNLIWTVLLTHQAEGSVSGTLHTDILSLQKGKRTQQTEKKKSQQLQQLL